ncbi:MAG: ABC transporter ATP-binding protein [Candidatus Limnocylindrales bacterium]
MTVAVRTERLTKRYGRSVAVAGLELEIEQGEIFGLVGPNGAGKTTTLKMLATLLPPTAGDAEVAGHSVRREADAVRNVIGYMPDTFGVYDDMRVWEYLDFFGRCYGLSASRRRQMIGDLLELVDLTDKRGAYVQELSRGMQQRLCLAHALVHDPQILLLDEPASGLDPRARVELRELLRELRSLGKTIVSSSHILPELEELCTSVAIMDHGKVLASGRVDDIAERFRVGGVYRATVVGDDDRIAAAEQHFAASPDIASVIRRPGGEIEFALRGDAHAAAAVLTAAVRAGIRVSSFAPAASDLEELFLQITDASAADAARELAGTQPVEMPEARA